MNAIGFHCWIGQNRRNLNGFKWDSLSRTCCTATSSDHTVLTSRHIFCKVNYFVHQKKKLLKPVLCLTFLHVAVRILASTCLIEYLHWKLGVARPDTDAFDKIRGKAMCLNLKSTYEVHKYKTQNRIKQNKNKNKQQKTCKKPPKKSNKIKIPLPVFSPVERTWYFPSHNINTPLLSWFLPHPQFTQGYDSGL